MSLRACDKETEVLEALRSGRVPSAWGDELRRHVSACPDCADLVLVTEHLQHESETVSAGARLPSASFVFWRAQLRARRESTEKALRPVRAAETLVAGALLAVLGSIGLWKGPALAPWFEAALPGFLNSSLALGIITAFVCLMGFVLYAVLAKE